MEKYFSHEIFGWDTVISVDKQITFARKLRCFTSHFTVTQIYDRVKNRKKCGLLLTEKVK